MIRWIGIGRLLQLAWPREDVTSSGRAAGGGAALLVALLAFAPAAAAQQEAALQETAGPPAALEDFAWLQGTWRGTAPDGATAEIHFMEPTAGVLPAVFRLVQDDRTLILEAISLVRESSGDVVMYVRHFNPALVPMEKERAIALELVRREGETMVFENRNEGQNPRRSFMRPTRDGGFLSVSELARSDGSTEEIRVRYHRVEGG